MLRHRNHLSDTAHRAQDHIEARFAGPLPLAEIASKCGVSERTLTRRFTEATGLACGPSRRSAPRGAALGVCRGGQRPG